MVASISPSPLSGAERDRTAAWQAGSANAVIALMNVKSKGIFLCLLLITTKADTVEGLDCETHVELVVASGQEISTGRAVAAVRLRRRLLLASDCGCGRVPFFALGVRDPGVEHVDEREAKALRNLANLCQSERRLVELMFTDPGIN